MFRLRHLAIITLDFATHAIAQKHGSHSGFITTIKGPAPHKCTIPSVTPQTPLVIIPVSVGDPTNFCKYKVDVQRGTWGKPIRALVIGWCTGDYECEIQGSPSLVGTLGGSSSFVYWHLV